MQSHTPSVCYCVKRVSQQACRPIIQSLKGSQRLSSSAVDRDAYTVLTTAFRLILGFTGLLSCRCQSSHRICYLHQGGYILVLFVCLFVCLFVSRVKRKLLNHGRNDQILEVIRIWIRIIQAFLTDILRIRHLDVNVFVKHYCQSSLFRRIPAVAHLPL